MKNRSIQLISCIAALALTACAPPASNDAPPILLFNGIGTSPNDVKAVEAVLKDRHLKYATVNSQQLNTMSEAQLMSYRLMIVPGGNYITIGNSVTPGTLNLTSGVRVGFYAEVNRGIHKAAVAIAGVGTPAVEHYWEDGPQFTGWGAVVGKYPDGTPAIVEGTSGKGWVILCGVHPEAPENWRRGMTFTTPASVANAYAGTLIDAALHGTWLPHY